jgi:prephenate dehydratase
MHQEIAFLGPAGTFCEQALEMLDEATGTRHVAVADITRAHVRQTAMAEVLVGLRSHCSQVVFLGTYSRKAFGPDVPSSGVEGDPRLHPAAVTG